MSVLISVPIDMAISKYSNLNHACTLYNKSKPVEVDFGMALQQIQNVVCVHSHTYVNIEISLLHHKDLCIHSGKSVKFILLLMYPAGITPISA